MSGPATPEVLAVGQMKFSGNIIPHTWFDHITFDNGKPQLNAIIILAEILYWYRPNNHKDESMRPLPPTKRFKSDILQKSYSSFAERFGLTKKQVRDAIVCLESLGVITRELRTINTPQGPASNLLYIRLHPDHLAELNELVRETPPYIEVDTPLHTNREPPISKETPPYVEVDTYTESTTKNTTQNTQRKTTTGENFFSQNPPPDLEPETPKPPPPPDHPPPPPPEKNSVQVFSFLKAKLSGNAKGSGDLLTELLIEDPERQNWLELPLDTVQRLIREAGRSRSTRRFTTTLIGLLDAELDNTKKSEREKYLKEPTMDEVLDAPEKYGVTLDGTWGRGERQ